MQPKLIHLERGDFLENYWPGLYEQGEHLYASEPTQQGKSHLLNQMLDATLPRLDEDCTVVSLMPKVKDPATSYWAPRLGFKMLERWPPPGRWPWEEKPPGYVLWPKHLRGAEPAVNRIHIGNMLRPALRDLYYRGNALVFADDAHVAATMMGLNIDFEDWLTMISGNQAGLWLATQAPTGSRVSGSLTKFATSAPTHYVFGHDSDERNIYRYGEIGGGAVSVRLVSEAVKNLRMFRIRTPDGRLKNISEKLYIHKGGPWMAVIGP
jgi:hypothetical protein